MVSLPVYPWYLGIIYIYPGMKKTPLKQWVLIQPPLLILKGSFNHRNWVNQYLNGGGSPGYSQMSHKKSLLLSICTGWFMANPKTAAATRKKHSPQKKTQIPNSFLSSPRFPPPCFFLAFRRVTPITAKSLVPLDPFFLTDGAFPDLIPKDFGGEPEVFPEVFVGTEAVEIFPTHHPKRGVS